MFQEVEAVHAGEFDVGDERVGLKAAEFCEGVFGTGNTEDVVAPLLQELFVAFARVVFVFDDQDAVFAFAGIGANRGACLFRHADALP